MTAALLRGFYTGCITSGNMGDDILLPIFIGALANALQTKYGHVPAVIHTQIPCNVDSWKSSSQIGVIGGGSIIHPEETSYTGPIEHNKRSLKCSHLFGTGISDTPKFSIPNEYKEKILAGDYSDLHFPINDVMKFNLKVANNCIHGGLRGPLDTQIAKAHIPSFSKEHVYDPGLMAAKYIAPSDLIVPYSDSNVIGINLAWVSSSNRICIPTKPENDGEFNLRIRKEVAEFCRFAINRGYSICMYPMSYGELSLHLDIINLLNDKTLSDKIFYVDRPLSNEDMMKLISTFKMAIAGRLHANVLAHANTVPTINLMYNYKAINYQESIGLRKYGIPTNAELTSNNLIQTFVDLEANYDSVKQSLAHYVAEATDTHLSHIDRMLDVIGAKSAGNMTIRWCTGNCYTGIFEVTSAA